MKSIKKLLICSLSLMLLNSIGLTNVSAHHIHYRHYHITRIMKKHIKRHRHKNRAHIKLGSTSFNSVRAYNTIHKDLTFVDKYKMHIKSSKIKKLNIKKNLEATALLKSYWKSFTPLQQRQLIQLGQPADGFHADFNLFNKMDTQVNNSQYGLAQASDQHSDFLNQIRTTLIQNINQTRMQHGLKPLKVTTIMQQTANHEVQWTQYAYSHLNNYLNYPHNTSNPLDNWVHGFDTHNSASDFMGNNNYNDWPYSNASTWNIGNGRQADGTPDPYSDNTPQGIANNIDDDFINHDMAQGNNNGHREIELNPNVQYLGVGVSYNPTINLGSVDEEYGNDVVFE